MNSQEEAARLAAEFNKQRDCGVVTFQIQERFKDESEPNSIDRLCGTLKFKGLGANWQAVSRSFTIEHLAALFYKDMAYSVVTMPAEAAHLLSLRALEFFGDDARYFTNGPSIPGELGGWPVSGATFDSGIAIVTPTHAGILWFDDED